MLAVSSLVLSTCGCRPRAARRGRPARRRAAALGAMARPGRAGHRERPRRAARVERDQERRLVGRDPRARALLARGLGRPHLPDDGDRGRRGARRQGRQAHDGGPGLPAPRRRRRRSQADARGAGARRGDAARSCGRRPPGRAPPTTRATSAAASPRRRRSPTASGSTRTSGRRASTSTTSRAGSSGAGRRGGIASFGVGVGTSPVLYEKLVILQCDEDNGEKSFIVALDRKTGKEAWRVRRNVEVSWATPILVASGGRRRARHRRQPGDHRLRPGDGRELWRIKGLESNAVPSPVAGDDVVVLSAGYPAKIALAMRAGGSGDAQRPRALALRQGHGVRALADPGRRPALPRHRQGARHLPRREDRQGPLRGRRGRRAARASWPRPSRSRATC